LTAVERFAGNVGDEPEVVACTFELSCGMSVSSRMLPQNVLFHVGRPTCSVGILQLPSRSAAPPSSAPHARERLDRRLEDGNVRDRGAPLCGDERREMV